MYLLNEIKKTIIIDNDNTKIGNTDLVDNERCNSNESTEKINKNTQIFN